MAQARYDPVVIAAAGPGGGAGAGTPFFDEEWSPDGRGWFIRRTEASFALTRRVPPRWDVVACTVLPNLGRRRLAHAVRQDMWRALQRIRGFRPVVEVTRSDGRCHLRAGGAVAGRVPAGLHERIARLLADPDHRAAWCRAAAHRGRG